MLTKNSSVLLCSVVFLSGVFFQNCSEREQKPLSPEEIDYSDSAYQFSLRVIETYLTADSSLFRTYLADTIYTLDDDTPFLSDTMQLTSIFSIVRDYSIYTIDDYLNTYDPEVHYKDSIFSYFDSTLSTWSISMHDYIFVGNRLKADKTELIWSDLLVFVVTKKDGFWKLKAFSG